jgi:hypothetical protein
MASKIWAYVMGALTLMYCLLLGNTAFNLIAVDLPVAKAMGILLLIFPVIAITFSVREFVFGSQLDKLQKQIESAGQWPIFDLELRPSGRPTKESAAANFVVQQKRVEADECNYLNWFALGLAYDAAGDRRRAREAMRQALKLANRE